MIGFITNQWDRDNLNFLLNTQGEELEEWHKQADEDDKAYAQELLDAYAEELRLEAKDLLIEATMSLMFEYPEAMQVIDTIAKR